MTAPGVVHVVGAGVAGLAAAVRSAAGGRKVALYESAARGGGRCRSYWDSILGREVDNGNHLVLSGNRAIAEHLAAIGAEDRLVGPDRACFPFCDVATGERWTLRPSAGRIPWWIFSAGRRAPGSRPIDYLRGLRLAYGPADATVADRLGDGPAFRRFWEPLAVAALNAAPNEGAARLLWPVLRETFGRGEAACRPRVARRSLADAFVDPALELLARAGADVRFHARLRDLSFEGDRLGRLEFTGSPVEVGPDDSVVLAVPPTNAAELVPGLAAPRGSRAILNAHFALPRPIATAAPIGVVGGLCQWIFVRGDVASVTVSAADDVLDESEAALSARMWREVEIALDLGAPAPPPAFRIIREKRATFLQSPTEAMRRPGCVTAWRNLLLAGDWTDTGLPATIEGAVRSGHTAAAKIAGARRDA